MKLSTKQKEVITLMRGGQIIHWLGGIKPHCFLSKDHNYKISISTCLKLSDLKIISRSNNNHLNDKYQLTELGKTIQLD